MHRALRHSSKCWRALQSSRRKQSWQKHLNRKRTELNQFIGFNSFFLYVMLDRKKNRVKKVLLSFMHQYKNCVFFRVWSLKWTNQLFKLFFQRLLSNIKQKNLFPSPLKFIALRRLLFMYSRWIFILCKCFETYENKSAIVFKTKSFDQLVRQFTLTIFSRNRKCFWMLILFKGRKNEMKSSIDWNYLLNRVIEGFVRVIWGRDCGKRRVVKVKRGVGRGVRNQFTKKLIGSVFLKLYFLFFSFLNFEHFKFFHFPNFLLFSFFWNGCFYFEYFWIFALFWLRFSSFSDNFYFLIIRKIAKVYTFSKQNYFYITLSREWKFKLQMNFSMIGALHTPTSSHLNFECLKHEFWMFNFPQFLPLQKIHMNP